MTLEAESFAVFFYGEIMKCNLSLGRNFRGGIFTAESKKARKKIVFIKNAI